ncbi:hypothetical protein EDD21DRAFT_39071 [Dissophora ornata]|nr:hypothetical protein EDD21DRAFT_39071 [Dissophora ornata]
MVTSVKHPCQTRLPLPYLHRTWDDMSITSRVPHQLSASAMEPEKPGPSAPIPGVASSLASSTATTPEDLYGQFSSGTSTGRNQGQPRRVSFGRDLTVKDLSEHHATDDAYFTSGSTPPIYSPRCFLGEDLPSSDPADMNFVDNSDLNLSTSRLYTWNFLDGPGRVDSDVDKYWVCNGIEVGGDLMAFRNRIVENNGGFTEPYEKL